MVDDQETNMFISDLRNKGDSPDPLPDGKPTQALLDPDNPLLEKFQKALKEHLLRQINQLKDDIFEYETGIKKNNAQQHDLGVLLYEQQQIIESQRKTIDEYTAKLETTTAACLEMENVVAEKKEQCRKQRESYLEIDSQERRICKEIEGTNLLIYQMTQWEDRLESHIMVKKRVLEKTRKDKLHLLEDKRKQDALIYRLMTKIWQLEQELETMNLQIKVKEEEREEMAQTVALGNTNIEAMESEYRSLMHSWNSVVTAIGNRDKILNCLRTEANKTQEKIKSVTAEIEQIKKLTLKEMKRNEELTLRKTRLANNVQNCKLALDAELEKKFILEKRMNEMSAIIDQTELDIQKIGDEANDTTNLLSNLIREQQQLDILKVELEDKIMREMEEEVTNNKTLTRLQRVLKQLKTKNREYEVQVASGENKIAAVLSEIESQKCANFESQRYLHELEEQLEDLGKEADGYQEETKQLELRISQRQREVDLLNAKYQKLMEKTGITYSSPLETKISMLEKNIEEIQEENKKLQQYWLREQSNLIKISEQRQEQIQTNDLIKKQILILEQNNLRITDDLNELEKEKSKVTKNINNLHSQLTLMGDTVCKTKGLKITMDKQNEILRQDYLYKLKDAELECLKLQDEITQVEADKVSLSNELIEINRQSLEWEKKYLSAKETKSTMSGERSKGGEVDSMKAEIHRMNVRYSQLRKVQEVLVHDLKHCVTRREAIVNNAEAREKRSKRGPDKTRINFNRKLDEKRNKIKQTEIQIGELQKKIENISVNKKEIEDEINSIEDEIKAIKSVSEEMKDHLEAAKTKRQMNFELLLQMQKKLKLYTELSKGRTPHMLYRTEEALTTEYKKQVEINSKLLKIVENLQGFFPNYTHELNRLCNTLKLPIYVYYQ